MSLSTVLILEESTTLREAMAAHLSSRGYVVMSAGTVAEASVALGGGRIGAAILVHTTRGPDLADLLIRLSADYAVPVVLITESAAVRRLPPDALPAVAQVLVRSRFSLTKLDRAVGMAMRQQ